MRGMFILVFSLLIGSCLKIPEGVKPVENFDPERFQGKWYEIARLDHSFERGLERVTAEYELQEKGRISVINRGYNVSKDKWSQAKGRAYYAGKEGVGFLKVSFFGPFYGSYVIFELDENYQYAFVSGASTSYLWLLARTPEVNKHIIDRFVELSSELGFDTEELIFVKH